MRVNHPAVLVWDDSLDVPAEVAGWVGVPRFGRLLHDRSRLEDRAAQLAADAGFSRILLVRDAASRTRAAEELREIDPQTRVVLWTSDVVGQDEHLAATLGKLAYAVGSVVAVPASGRPGTGVGSAMASVAARWLSLPSREERRVWLADRRDEFDILDAAGLHSLADPAVFIRWLSGAFYTRAFNAMSAVGRTLRKESKDVAKMRRECRWWGLLPESLRRFGVMPFDYQEADGRASYRMERLVVPDAAVLWLHGPDAMTDTAFDAVLDAVGDFLAERPQRGVGASQGAEVAERAYVTKVTERIRALQAMPVGASVEAALVGVGGLDGLVQRYLELLRAEWSVRPPGDAVAVQHGDLCFSNILVDPRTGLVRFIDPKGADTEADLYGDPFYDLAKLSHSVLGGYDSINHGLFDLTLGDDLRPDLRMDRPQPEARAARFAERVRNWGADLRRIRIYEVSLFLSMLPLHAESPRKVVAFALNADRLMRELAAGPAPRSWRLW